MSDERGQPMEGEVLEPEDAPRHLMRAPATPITVSDLAALKGEGVEIIQSRVQIIETLRIASIRATYPEDWVLFKAPDSQGGQIVGYLQDAGADRIRDLWGIEVFDIGDMERITSPDGASFMYLVSGAGRCKITRQTVDRMEGGRQSDEDFCKGKTGAGLELAVRKAARANLDGGITRELAGMRSVPLAEIEAAWKGTAKKVENCRKGRGFGSMSTRETGAAANNVPDVAPPVCPHCQTVGAYRPASGNRGAFYGCPKWKDHEQKKWFQDAAEWIAKAKAAPPATAAPAQGAGRVTSDLRADDVFGSGGRHREPGEEG